MDKYRASYKNKITYVILSFLICCISSGVLSGCGGEIKTERAENPGDEILPGEGTGKAGSVGEEMAEGGPAEKGLLTLQEELRPCVLQIYCGDYRGSGVVWEMTEEEVRVISSGHLLENGETCEVLCYAGVYYEAKVDRILEDCDIGFAVFSAEALKEDGVELRAVSRGGRSGEDLVQGEELIVYGSMDDVAGNFVRGYLIDADSEIQFEGYDRPQHFILGGIPREAEDTPGENDGAEDGGTEESTVREREDAAGQGAVDAGMSGSGVFDRQGNLLGILAGGDGESGFAAVPVWEILTADGQSAIF